MTSLLNIASAGLSAAQGTLATISHNIANANTPGYSRQEAVLSTASGTFTGSGFFGRGVDLTTVRRQYDAFLTQSVRTGGSQAAADTARSSALNELDGLFSDSSLGIGAAVDSMFSAASDMANRPADASARQAFISRASQLAQRLDAVGSQMDSMGQLANARLTQAATQANSALSQIKSLNERIAQVQGSGQQPNDLLDQRDAAVQQLGTLMSVTVVAGDNGALNLFANNGAALLVGNQQATLATVPDPADTTHLALQLSNGPVKQLMDSTAVGGGTMAGVMKFRDEDLVSAQNQVGRLAGVIADAFNAQQANGVDATGAQGSPLFTVAGPVTHPHSANTGSGAVAVTVGNASALKASDYRVDWDGSAYTVTRLSDGTATSTTAFPATVDGLTFTATGSPASGDSFVVRPFSAASTSLAARPLSPSQLATGYAVTVESAQGNKGSAAASKFAVTQQSASTVLPVTITFNNPPTSYNVTGLASGNLTNVAYTPGAAVPPAPATYNGWSMVIDGAAAAGDTFAIKPNAQPGADNRNALAMNALADMGLVDGATINEGYAALLGDTGVRVQGARDAAEVSGTLQTEASTRQQNLAGVNLDEEAANLLRFQQAYQASAKVIQASQQLFDALLSATSR